MFVFPGGDDDARLLDEGHDHAARHGVREERRHDLVDRRQRAGDRAAARRTTGRAAQRRSRAYVIELGAGDAARLGCCRACGCDSGGRRASDGGARARGARRRARVALPRRRAPTPTPTGDQILARAKAVFRAYARPPFVAYTLVRRDTSRRRAGLREQLHAQDLVPHVRPLGARAARVARRRAYGGLEHVTVDVRRRGRSGSADRRHVRTRVFAPTPPRSPRRDRRMPRRARCR